jgi:hypothetical protein
LAGQARRKRSRTTALPGWQAQAGTLRVRQAKSADSQEPVFQVNIFVLCTGRCGSTTFVRAAQHMTNFTSGHETRAKIAGPGRLAYPDNHIEADNRLSWFLGRLDRAYGRDARYVHLTRDPEQVAESFNERWDPDLAIISAYRKSILKGAPQAEGLDICRDYIETVTANIEHFLADKPQRMEFQLETADRDWRDFWQWIGAEGDLEASLREWSVAHNRRPGVAAPARRSLRDMAKRVFAS